MNTITEMRITLEVNNSRIYEADALEQNKKNEKKL